MIEIIFYMVIFCVLAFLIKATFHLNSIRRKDITMFAMAELRRDILLYLRLKHNKISSRDAQQALDLIDNCSWTISNHEKFYGEFTNFKDFKETLTINKSEVEEVEEVIGDIKNKKIKGFYINFGIILLKNISKHISLFRFQAVIFIVSFLAKIFWANKFELLSGYFRWYEDTNTHFSKYEDKHKLSF